MRGHLALARIGDSLPLEVLNGIATLNEVAPRSVHRADDDFPASREVLRLRQGYSTKIGSDKGLTLAL